METTRNGWTVIDRAAGVLSYEYGFNSEGTAKANAVFASDLLCNWDRFPGNSLVNFIWRMTKSGPGFSIFHLAMKLIIKDKKLVLSTFLKDLEAHPPAVIVPAHGSLIARDGLAAETYQLLAAAL